MAIIELLLSNLVTDFNDAIYGILGDSVPFWPFTALAVACFCYAGICLLLWTNKCPRPVSGLSIAVSFLPLMLFITRGESVIVLVALVMIFIAEAALRKMQGHLLASFLGIVLAVNALYMSYCLNFLLGRIPSQGVL
jgi:hypothetical protein